MPELSPGVLSDCLGLKWADKGLSLQSGGEDGFGGSLSGGSLGCLKAGGGFERDAWRFWRAPDEFRVPLSCAFGCDNGGGLWRDVFDERGRFALVCADQKFFCVFLEIFPLFCVFL